MSRRMKSVLMRIGGVVIGCGIGPLSLWLGWPESIIWILMAVSLMFYCFSMIILFGLPLPPAKGSICYICGAEAEYAIHHSWSPPSVINPPEAISVCENHRDASAARGRIWADGKFHYLNRS